MDSIIGAGVTVLLGVLVIAGIYQLGKSSNPIVPTAGSAYSQTLNSIFK